MTDPAETATSVALVGYVLTHSLLASLIRRKILSPHEAAELIDGAILNLEKLDATVGNDRQLLRLARADLESTLEAVRKAAD